MGQILENGSYEAVAKKYSVGPRANGKLTLYFEFDVNGTSIQGQEFLENNDGVITPAKIQRVRDAFPKWDGTAEGLSLPENFEEQEVNITVANEASAKNPDVVYTQVKWINPKGQTGPGAKMPDPVAKNELVAKYGATLRALTPQAVKAPAAKPKAPPAAKPKGPPPAKKADGPAPTMEECWEQCMKAFSQDQEKAEAKWNEIIAGREYDTINDDGWRDVMKALAEILPY